jgi:hypothetical protein
VVAAGARPIQNDQQAHGGHVYQAVKQQAHRVLVHQAAGPDQHADAAGPSWPPPPTPDAEVPPQRQGCAAACRRPNHVPLPSSGYTLAHSGRCA